MNRQLPTRGESARDQLYSKVKQMILSGDLPPNAPISENELATSYGVSRTPAREALHRLSLEGFVQIVPKRGTFVSPVPSSSEVRQLYEYREAVAGMSAHLAAARGTPEDVEHLEELLTTMSTATESDVRGDAADSFIRAIDVMSGNELLIEANQRFLDRLHWLRQNLMRLDTTYFDVALEKRRALVGAIASKDSDAAEEIARDIVRTVRGEVMRMLAES